MKILGLTGPSGSGKAVVGQRFSERGIPVLDTDAVYHAWIERPTPCTEELARTFGKEILTPDGAVDRKRLAAIVFSDDDAEKTRLRTLNAISHRYVLESCRTWLEEQKKAGKRACIIDAPLLIEAELHKACDYVIAVLAPREIRLDRIVKRDGISREAAEARILAQKQDEFYKAHADFLFVNDGSLSMAQEFVEAVISNIFRHSETEKKKERYHV
ncbi:MAG: dephospho-CoA kinase [Ruminococcaceae bacterium]|nr:dephospho-CoA kinase [Oscillospiraceae bacterium]